jgi:hypothetical protein
MRTTTALLAATVLGLAACGDDDDDGAGGGPTLDAGEVVDAVDNPFLPLAPGSRWVYEGVVDGVAERVVVEVLDERRPVMGIDAVVVLDRAFEDGELVEETYDWFAQDADGNVWYLGEDSHEIDDGVAVSSDGSWEAGVDGARPGIVMLADPREGDEYRQELYPGEAEDMAEVVAVEEDRVVTREWNPLEPGVEEEKTYERGVGLVEEVVTEGGEGGLRLVEHVDGDQA